MNLLLLPGCVLSVTGTTTFTADVERVELDLSKGDVAILGQSGDVTLDVDFAGLSASEVGPEIRDGVLYVDFRCGGPELCGGDLTLTVPPLTPVEVRLGAGELRVTGLKRDLLALLGAGSIDIEDHGVGPVDIVTGVGDATVAFLQPPDRVQVDVATGHVGLELPPGPYDLDLSAPGGVFIDPGVVDDPGSPHGVTAETGAGRVDVRVR